VQAVDQSVRGTSLKVMTDRVNSLRESGRTERAHADGERARFFTESWRETEGQSLGIRRAKAYSRYLNGVTPAIFDGELIVGSPTKYRCGGQPALEYISEVGKNIAEGLEFTIRRQSESGEVAVEDAQAIADAYRFWEGKSTSDVLRKRWFEILGDDFMTGLQKSRVGLMVGLEGPPGPKSADYPKLLAVGLRGLVAEARQRMTTLDYCQRDAVERRDYLRSSQEGTPGDRRGLQLGARESPAHLPGSASVLLVHPPGAPHRVRLHTGDTGPDGPVSLSLLRQRHRRRPVDAGPGR
jgi:hypothetical protein